MEGVHEREKISKFAPEDVISSMPDNVVTNILDRLALEDAVRTGILSRNWRFKWTMLSQLIFDDKFFEYLVETKDEKNHGKIITRLLLHLKGSVTKFILSVDKECCSVLDEEDIAHWVLFLSRNAIKDLTFSKRKGKPLKLPTHLFSCLDLKHLKLVNCSFDPPVNFHGFPNLLSLELDMTPPISIKLGKLITRCPLLQILKMRCGQRDFSMYFYMIYCRQNKLRLAEVSKLVNLRELSLSLCLLEDLMIMHATSIFELVDFLPKLQSLHLDYAMCNIKKNPTSLESMIDEILSPLTRELTEVGAKRTLPTAIPIPCLKTLRLSGLDLYNDIVISYVFEMIRHFSNVQTLEINAIGWNGVVTPKVCSPEVGILQLQSVAFTYINASENEVCLMKYLLACSPFLKRMVIRDLFLPRDQKLKFAIELLKFRRASTVAEILLC